MLPNFDKFVYLQFYRLLLNENLTHISSQHCLPRNGLQIPLFIVSTFVLTGPTLNLTTALWRMIQLTPLMLQIEGQVVSVMQSNGNY